MSIYLKVFNFIKQIEPYSVYLLLIVFILSSFLEAIGISLVMPLIALVIEDNFLNIIENSKFGIYFPDYILNMKRDQALLFISISLIILYLLKNVLLILSEYMKTSFTGKLKANLSNQLINKYLHQNYIYHSKKNTTQINSIINQKVIDVTDGMIASVLTIFAEIILIIGLLCLIIFVKQLNTFVILILLFSAGLLFAKIINTYIKKIGLVRKIKQDIKFKYFNSIINNFREILLTGKKKLYYKNFEQSLNTIAKLDAIRGGLQRSPQLIFETIGILGLILIIYYLMHLNASPLKILTVCTFFAAVSYRAIPSLHKIFYFHYNIKYYSSIFEEINNEIKINNIIEYHDDKYDKINSISLHNVSFKYSKEKNYILNNISLKINNNTTIGIYGSSGSGKTTLLDIISGLLEPTVGSISINEEKINNNYLRRKLQNNLSYISQKTTIINDTLLNNICFGEDKFEIDIKRYEEAIKNAGLTDFAKKDFNNSEILLDSGKNISGGQLQRIGIARALYSHKDILIFDESTNALDEKLEKKIITNISQLKKNKIIFFVSHNLDIMHNLDYIFEVKEGYLKEISKS